MYNKLPEKDYVAIVVGGSNDIMHRGAVRAKILGITNDFADEDQPYVYPAITNGLQQVPPIGYYLRVRFLHGDINSGYYYAMSPTANIAPPVFTESYPDVAVGNLGEDGFFYTHNRQTHITEINNPGNNSQLTWDAAGFVTYESNVAHKNAGMGAKTNTGENLQHVLTEGTIDIFTCMPVGHNRKASGIGQGSEYLTISHISQATIDAFHGTMQPQTPTETPTVPQTESDIPKIDLVNMKGEVVDHVPIERTDQMVKRKGKVAKRIIVCHSEKECFPVMCNKFMTTMSNAHYLVGWNEGDPEILSDAKPVEAPTMPNATPATGSTAPATGEAAEMVAEMSTPVSTADDSKQYLKNTGFYQFIDIEDDAGMFGDATVGGEKANVDAVIIMLVNGFPVSDFTSYQREKVNILVQHIRKKFDNPDLPVITPNDFDTPNPRIDMSGFPVDGY